MESILNKAEQLGLTSDLVKVKNGHYGMQAIHMAAMEGHLDVMKMLVSKCPELVLERGGYWNDTPLKVARNNNHYNIIKWLTEEMGVKQ